MSSVPGELRVFNVAGQADVAGVPAAYSLSATFKLTVIDLILNAVVGSVIVSSPQVFGSVASLGGQAFRAPESFAFLLPAP
jgi:hypothetical protein